MEALTNVERPTPEHIPRALNSILNTVSGGARRTHEALVLHGDNAHGAVFARRKTIAETRRKLGAPGWGSSLRSISRHLQELEDAGLIIRLVRRHERQGGEKTWYPLILLLGRCLHTDAMVGLSGAVCFRLAWGPEGIGQALRDGTLDEPVWIPGPWIDPHDRRRGQRRLYLHTYLPPLRRRRKGRGAMYDNRLSRHPRILGTLRIACWVALRARAAVPLPLKVCQFSAHLIEETPASQGQSSAPGGADCRADSGTEERSRRDVARGELPDHGERVEFPESGSGDRPAGSKDSDYSPRDSAEEDRRASG